jgi:hypothetical protein
VAKKAKLNKREILLRLLDIPDKGRRPFFSREMKLLNDLCDRYSQEFMSIVSFRDKFDSLIYLTSPKLKKTLDKKFRAFNFRVDFSKYPKYDIGDKVGKDVKIKNNKKTIKDFLDD